MARTKTTRLKTKKRHGKGPGKAAGRKTKSESNKLLVRGIGFGIFFGLVLTALIFALPDPVSNKEQPLQLKAVKAPEARTIERPNITLKRSSSSVKKAVPPAQSLTHTTPKAKVRIAVVIDDVGHDWESLTQAAQLPDAVTLAILPYVNDVQKKADFARAKGHEILVHLPMAPKSTGADPGPMALRPDIRTHELARRIQWNLSQFTGYMGINNHMGSLFTENQSAMRELFIRLQERGAVFIDSRTTAHSAGALLAHEMALPYAERDVFLDNAIEANAVGQQLSITEQKARENGNAIAIGHPHTVTLDTLASWSQTLDSKGIELVPVSQIIQDRGTALWRSQLQQNKSIAGFGSQ